MLNKLNIQIKSVLKKKIQVSSEMVGAKIKPFKYKVLFRQTSNYAASIFDENSIYYDTNRKQKIVAHPLFPVRISWKIAENINEHWEIDFPTEALENFVHHSEYLEIHRLLKPGDVLTIHGELAAFLPHKLGAKIILKFDYFDKADEHVQTELIGAILFGVKCTDKGKTSIELPSTERIKQSSPIWEEQIIVPRSAPFIYDGCNDIVYPIHTDIKFAQNMGLPDIVLQGTATLAKSVTILIKKELEKNPNRVKMISGKFSNIVVPPNQLTVLLQKRNETELYFNVTDKNGKIVLKGGYLKFART